MKLYIRKWKRKAKQSSAQGGAHTMRRLSSAASKHAKEMEKFATEGEDIKEVGHHLFHQECFGYSLFMILVY